MLILSTLLYGHLFLSVSAINPKFLISQADAVRQRLRQRQSAEYSHILDEGRSKKLLNINLQILITWLLEDHGENNLTKDLHSYDVQPCTNQYGVTTNSCRLLIQPFKTKTQDSVQRLLRCSIPLLTRQHATHIPDLIFAERSNLYLMLLKLL